MTLPSTGAKSKPVLDEGGFQQLLAAAYVLQQHNDSLQAKDPRLDAAWIFSQISETETLVRHASVTFATAAGLVSERLCKVTGAVSVSVCLLDGENVDCVVENGVAAGTPGRSIAAASIAATERLRNGRQFQSLDAQADTRLDIKTCGEMGIRSLLAVPIQRSDQTAGLIEVRWGLANALHECDVRTCRLMANLLTEVLDREHFTSTPSSKTLVNALEHSDPPKTPAAEAASPSTASYSSPGQPNPDLAAQCRVCGRPFSADEAFCGNCSMPRVSATAAGEGLQSKWASMWFMQQAQDSLQDRQTASAQASPLVPPVPKLPWPGIPAAPEAVSPTSQVEPVTPLNESRTADHAMASAALDSTPPVEHDVAAQDFGVRIFEDESIPIEESSSQYWSAVLARMRALLAVRLRISRRIATIAVGSVIFFLMLATWVSWPSQPSPHLSWLESFLVELGLAEVQSKSAPIYAGDPKVRVWVDVHTALYYCPDLDLYGKTPGGRFSSQRTAQADQFEPATRVACK